MQTACDQGLMTEAGIPPPSDASYHTPSPPTRKSPNRRDAHLRGAHALLTDWRSKTWSRLYSKQIWGTQALLSDKAIANLALHTIPLAHASVERLEKEGMAAFFARKHGEEIVRCLNEYDQNWREKHEIEKQQRSNAKKRDMAIGQKTKAD